MFVLKGPFNLGIILSAIGSHRIIWDRIYGSKGCIRSQGSEMILGIVQYNHWTLKAMAICVCVTLSLSVCIYNPTINVGSSNFKLKRVS